MRLFIAINFEYEVKQRLTEIQDRLRKYAVSGNFTARENLHMTLVFFGEKDANELAGIKRAMNRINLPAFKTGIGGLDKFRGSGGNTWWAGISNHGSLVELHGRLVKELAAEGIEFADGKFHPHITLVRQAVLKNGFDCQAFNDKIATMPAAVTRVSLMESARVTGRLVYNEIYSRQLQ